MDRERIDPLIDRTLRDELSAKPSADFHARFDERLAHERERRIIPWWLTLALVSGAAAALVLVAVLMRPPAREPRAVSATPPIVASAPAPVPPRAMEPRAEANGAAPPAARRQAPASAAELPDVEVIVPRGQADALERFAEDLNDSVAKGRWVPVLAAGAPNSGFYVLPMAPTIERLPAAGSYDSIERK
jgi:hypothetical protein